MVNVNTAAKATKKVGENASQEQLALVPESVLKKRHDLEDLVRKRAANNEQAKKQKGGSRAVAARKKSGKKAFYVMKPETILARTRSRHNQEIRYKRVRKKGMQKRAVNYKTTSVKQIEQDAVDGDKNESTVVSIEYQSNSVGAPMVFCVRIRDDASSTPIQVKQALDRLRLKQIHDGVFLKYKDDASNRKLLQLVAPYVVYGPPSVESVQDLIERRGYAKIDQQRIPLSDNTVIEDHLGDAYGILCVKDLVHELTTVSENFNAISKFLYPFQLADSKTKFERRTLKLKDGKEYGDRGEAINDYIKQVL